MEQNHSGLLTRVFRQVYENFNLPVQKNTLRSFFKSFLSSIFLRTCTEIYSAVRRNFFSGNVKTAFCVSKYINLSGNFFHREFLEQFWTLSEVIPGLCIEISGSFVKTAFYLSVDFFEGVFFTGSFLEAFWTLSKIVPVLCLKNLDRFVKTNFCVSMEIFSCFFFQKTFSF